MSKTVMIPNDTRPTWSCEINGVRYAYAAGTEQTVPDEVAALIEANAANVIPENPPETGEQTARRVAKEVFDENIDDALPGAATTTAAGIVKKAANVTEATSDTLLTTVNGIISALIAAGLMEAGD